MTSAQIDFFLSAARHQSFTRAAEELYTTQPTVSRQISALESELAMQLFIRVGKVLHLTPEGKLLREELARARQVTQSALYRARQLRSGLSGSLSLGCLTALDTGICPLPVAVGFAKANSKVDLSIEVGSFSVLRSRLDSGICDVIFSLGFDLAAYEGVDHLICCRPVPLLVIAADHPLAVKECCTVADFADETFLLPDRSECFGRGNALRNILLDCGIPDPQVSYVRNSESVLLGILCGRGVGLLSAGHRCAGDPRYKSIPLPEGLNLPVPAVVAVWKRESENPVLPAFLKALRQHCGTP